MALTNFKILPGIDKQDTSVGADRRWVDSDLVRFRYGLPEKIGGWSSLLQDTIVGVSRKLHSFVDLEGNRYTSIGTDKFLLIYFEGQIFDITPVQSALAAATIATTNASPICSITKAGHGLAAGDIILLDSVTLPVGTGYVDADFEDKLFQVTSITSASVFTITQTTNATGTVSTGGSISIIPYETVGPAQQTYGYGFGVGQYGGTVSGASITTINNAGVLAAAATSVILTDSSVLPASGILLINNELITYSANNTGTNTISGMARGQLGTTDVEHLDGSTVTDATDYTGWGEAVLASTVTLEPGLWSLDNYGDVLVATIANGKTFTWDSSIAARLTTRASTGTAGYSTSDNPTASRATLISPTTRHLIHLGTELTLGDPNTQDDMFIRFSDQENINDYVATAINSAGSQRLQDGSKIMGALLAKETILVWTDNSLYTMKFIGSPFTFGFEQVGTNCGLIGKNAAIEIDGVAFWMSNNGFFMFDGTVKTLPCSVEDYIFDDFNTTKGQQVAAGLNNLFTEITWYYPSTNSNFNNRYVTVNYGSTQQSPNGTWYTGTNTNAIRTAWVDTLIYPKPYATSYDSSATGSFPIVIGESGLGQSSFYEHEVGTDQINPNGSTTSLSAFVQSYDFALNQDSPELFLALRRFVPDFKTLTGSVQVYLTIKNYPADSLISTPSSPYTIYATTDKIDTRARGRYANLKIENIGNNETWRFGTLQIDIQSDGRR
jgi:hypothetical protein